MRKTLEFAIHMVIEKRMEPWTFDRRHINDEMGRLAYDPKILLKILLGYSGG